MNANHNFKTADPAARPARGVMFSGKAFLAVVFVAGAVVGFALWNHIFLPFSNPHHVVGVLPRLGFNPLNNSVRFVIFVLCPIVFMIGFYLMAGKRRGGIFSGTENPADQLRDAVERRKLYRILTFVVLLSASLYRISMGMSAGGANALIDHYHEGEILGAAESYANGQAPYRDFYMLHGVYQDPARVLVAFSLFGRSIAATRILESIHMLMLMASLALLVFLMHRGDERSALLHAAILSGLLLLGLAGYFQVTERDIVLFLFLCVLIWMIGRGDSLVKSARDYNAGDAVPAMLFSFLPVAAYAYSLDRGFILTAAYLTLWPILCFAHHARAGQRIRFIAWSLLGLLLGFLVLGFAVRWALGGFFRFTFVQLPSYKELMDGMAWNFGGSPQAIAFRVIAVLMVALSAFWMMYRFLSAAAHREGSGSSWWSKFLRTHTLEIGLSLMALVTFRYALQFGSRAHVAAGSLVTVLFLTYIAIRHFGTSFQRTMPRLSRMILAGVIPAAMLIIAVHAYRIVSRDLIARAFPFGRDDQEFLTEDYRQTLTFLKEHVNDREDFVSLTNEATWYYFLKRPSPISFPVAYFAVPDYFQRQVVSQLDRKPVKWILYRNANWCNTVCDISNEERSPIVFDYVRRNFHPYVQIASHEIWVRNSKDD